MPYAFRCLCFFILALVHANAQMNVTSQTIPITAAKATTFQQDSRVAVSSAIPTAYYPPTIPQRPKTITFSHSYAKIDSLLPTRIPMVQPLETDPHKPTVIIIIFILSALGFCMLLFVRSTFLAEPNTHIDYSNTLHAGCNVHGAPPCSKGCFETSPPSVLDFAIEPVGCGIQRIRHSDF
ncbi:hypothetical protein BJ138DRAFT_1143474 [Hygrophoropsis aurantiaca]|uniref:Uncharacterized protein n=1 Tax=Hygrophoropsis aurantiaca TaxID=72124 RepID=A0ACB8ANK5_9AGAM|nr:hypothetical protein BJ138DRAFT_1143474 [Hygrophoropsis aurantiaca]